MHLLNYNLFANNFWAFIVNHYFKIRVTIASLKGAAYMPVFTVYA